MNPSSSPAAPHTKRLLDFWSIGWVLVLALLMCGTVVWLWFTRLPQRLPSVGDGRTIESYNFDLSTLLVPRDRLAAAGFPKDGLPAMVDPPVFTIEQAKAYAADLKKGHQGKFLVVHDRIIAVEIKGETRAYPIAILNWHEVVNDTLGGVPIAVTFSPLTDSAVVFDRRVGDEVLTFGVSGIVYNSHTLLYDRRNKEGTPAARDVPRESFSEGESLWSQLEFRAIAGPAAARGATLEVLPSRVMHWGEWEAQHAQTTILAPDRARSKVYKRTYEPYFANDTIRFPVSPLVADELPRKTRVVAARIGDDWHALKMPEIVAAAGDRGSWETTLGGSSVVVHHRAEPDVAWITTPDGDPVPSVTALWFAWYAREQTLPSTREATSTP